MTTTDMGEMLATITSDFKTHVLGAAETANNHIEEVKLIAASTLGLNNLHDLSETSFMAVLEFCEKLSGDLQSVFVEAGYDRNLAHEWTERRNSPAPSERREVARRILGLTIDAWLLPRLRSTLQELTAQSILNKPVSYQRPIPFKDFLTRPLTEYPEYANLSSRIRNNIRIIRRIETMAELATLSDDDILRTPNLGIKSLTELVAFLRLFGLSFGCFSSDEVAEIWARRTLNENMGKPICTSWATRRHGSLDHNKEVKADPELISALSKVGIQYRTELATAPKHVVDSICGDRDDWRSQLEHVLNSPYGNYPKSFILLEDMWNLSLHTKVPRCLHPEVRVYTPPA